MSEVDDPKNSQEQVEEENPENQQESVEEEIPENHQEPVEEDDRIESMINEMDAGEKQYLLFSLLYLASRPVFFDEILPIIPFTSSEEFDQFVTPMINRINEELKSRSAPYYVHVNKEKHVLSIELDKEILKKIEFSELIFSKSKLKISREKMKILSFISYKTIIRHTLASLDDLMSKFGVSGINLTNELEKDGFVYQKRIELEDRGKLVTYELTNKFFEVMNFPKEQLELSGYLRDFFTNYLTEEEEDEEEDDEYEF
ncbi:MAG: SMC-Scp complex subunit ScpB [Candidatus Hodarchaeales archaeon]|jgi:chromosome segregation and condensation protein ScpB